MAFHMNCDCPACQATYQDVWEECIDRVTNILDMKCVSATMSEEAYDDLVLSMALQMSIMAGFDDDGEPHTMSETYQQKLEDFDRSLTGELNRLRGVSATVIPFKRKGAV